MQHCHDDHEQHGGHDHSHDHSHDHDDVEDANGDSLYPFIDTSKLRVLNAQDPQAAAHPFKPFHERHDRSRFLASNDDDPELLLFIPFTNRDDIDFSSANELPAQQTLNLAEDQSANIDYPLQRLPPFTTLCFCCRVRKFQGVSSITLFVEDSFGGDETRIYYIGLKGESNKWRHGVVECVYEARPQPADHKVKDMTGSTSLI
ncbi:hypothetical protein BBJ28_00008434 [Nothophytophthora sp. Chile5]|nr:hypothetical protein BBJ28_00008434 [Nothophytophthora sp. Chile5]